jgi:hypothetical protein
MSVDGTYCFVYSGANGLGVGVFKVETGKFEGADYVGGRYTGTAHANEDGTIALDIEFDVPAGLVLVQGTAPQEIPYRRRITQNIPAAFGDGRAVELNSPPGSVIVMVKRVPDWFASALKDGITISIGSTRLTP